MSEKIWDCRIIVGDVELPNGMDAPPRRAAIEAIERHGISVLECSSGWGGITTPQIRKMRERIAALEALLFLHRYENIYLDTQLNNAREQITDLERVAEEAVAVYESDAHATRTQALHWKNTLMQSLANALRAAGYLGEGNE